MRVNLCSVKGECGPAWNREAAKRGSRRADASRSRESVAQAGMCSNTGPINRGEKENAGKTATIKRAFVVYTPNGDWRDVFARNADEAKLYVFRLTCGRVPMNEMSANLQFANH